MIGEDWGVAAAIRLLEDRGFTGGFHVAPSPPAALVCGSCGHRVPPAAAEVEELFRFEGVSDPDDQALVAAVRCQICGDAGTFVAAYGREASGAEAEVIAGLADTRRRS